MRTRLSICARKTSYPTRSDALAAIRREAVLRAYRCDRCRNYHLTGRTKGKRVPRPPSTSGTEGAAKN